MQGEGLLQKRGAGFESAFVDDGVLGIAGQVQHFDLWPQSGDALGQFPPAHSGHDDVGDQNVDGSGLGLSHAQTRNAVSGFQYRVAPRFEGFANQFTHRVFIFHQQYGFRSAGGPLGMLLEADVLCGVGYAGQVDLEIGAIAGFTLREYNRYSPDLNFRIITNQISQGRLTSAVTGLLKSVMVVQSPASGQAADAGGKR